MLARRGIPFPPLRKAQLLSISLSFFHSLSYSFLQRYPGCSLVLLGSIPLCRLSLYCRTLFLIPPVVITPIISHHLSPLYNSTTMAPRGPAKAREFDYSNVGKIGRCVYTVEVNEGIYSPPVKKLTRSITTGAQVSP